MKKKYRDRGLEVVMLTREPASLIQRIEDLAKAPVTILVGADAMFDEYTVRAIPRTYYFDGKGQRRAVIEGYSPTALDEVDRHLQAETKTASAAR